MTEKRSSQNSLPQLLNILDSIIEGIYCIDKAGLCTYCNQRCVELLGYSSDRELIGKHMHKLVHHSHRDGRVYPDNECKISMASQTGAKIHVDDEVFWRKDASHFEAEYWSFPLHEGNQTIGAVVKFTDVTLNRIETNHRNHLAQLVQTSHDGIISRDLAGRITSWNRGAREIYGFDAEEAIGQTIQLLLTDEGSQEEDEIREAIKSGEELLQFHVKRKRKNGDPCDISVTISPLRNLEHKLIGCSSVERDITESLKAKRALLRAIRTAENAQTTATKANEARTEFLANVSHELRTPMNAILGMLRLSLAENPGPLVTDYLTVAKTSANSLLQLVNDLLDFAKIESGTFKIEREAFDLRGAVDTPAKLLSAPASEKGLEILCEIDGEIPPHVIGDGVRIQQVLTNLISNAVKFTDSGEIIVKVKKLRELPDEVRVRIGVTDTGIGITPDDQKSVLLPFNQADMSSTRRHQGTGLGLSICRELVSLMGGTLRLESQPGRGSHFFFDLSLPVGKGNQLASKVPVDSLKGVRVLIVDDNPTNLRILEKIFVNWSMQPIVADNAEQAMRIIDQSKQEQSHHVSVAIIDALMPNIDGFELVKKLTNKYGKAVPPFVLMQSAADLGLTADRSLDIEVAHYLTKPVSQSALLDAVVDSLDLYSSPTFTNAEGAPSKSTTHPKRKLSVLLVEDLPANQVVAQAILKKRGHNVEIASNGREALDMTITHADQFDAILMDIQMPVMDGLQATAAIRASPNTQVAETPIIAMTAHAMQGDREACLAAGMDAYISKPFDAQLLIELVESIVEIPNANETDDSTGKNQMRSPNRPPGHQSNHSRSNLVEHEAALARLGGDQDLFAEFIEIFMSDSPKIARDLKNSIASGKAANVQKSAHALKGLMSNFGAKACVEIAREFERAGRIDDLDAIKHLLPEFDLLYEQLCDELRHF